MVWGLLKKAEKLKPVAKPALKPSARAAELVGPPITAEELGANLSALERKLNHEMKCPAGKNQVFLRSLLTSNGTTKPRIALKCHLRRDIGLSQEVFYEHIRDVCCSDPTQCPAYQAFKNRFVQT